MSTTESTAIIAATIAASGRSIDKAADIIKHRPDQGERHESSVHCGCIPTAHQYVSAGGCSGSRRSSTGERIARHTDAEAAEKHPDDERFRLSENFTPYAVRKGGAKHAPLCGSLRCER